MLGAMLHRIIGLSFLKLVGLGVRSEARSTDQGMEASYATVFKVFPIIGFLIFTFAGFLALNDSDSADRACCVFGFGLAAWCMYAILHRFTFRAVAANQELVITSMVAGDKRIKTNLPFDLSYPDEGRTLKIRQGSERVSINCTMHGHGDLRRWVELKLLEQKN